MTKQASQRTDSSVDKSTVDESTVDDSTVDDFTVDESTIDESTVDELHDGLNKNYITNVVTLRLIPRKLFSMIPSSVGAS